MSEDIWYLNMKLHTFEAPSGNKSVLWNFHKGILLALTLILLTIIPPLSTNKNLPSSLPNIWKNTTSLKTVELEKKCDLFRGSWVPKSEQPYYTNDTCDMMFEYQNCLKFGRTDREFLKWRWKPDECELPLFDSAQFLEIVKGKSLAFVGDSVARNHMQSLLCLLSNVSSFSKHFKTFPFINCLLHMLQGSHPEDVSLKYNLTYDFKRWFFADYNFTVARFWSPFLVKSKDADQNGFSSNSLMNLYLDEADQSWTSAIESFDYVVFSAGQWFFRPQVYYENGRIIGCFNCQKSNVTQLMNYYGYGKVFQTAFRTIMSLKGYKGVTLMRTFSPSHFENGEWNKGGDCARTRPFTKEETKRESYVFELHKAQVEEFKAAEKEGMQRGLQFRLLDTTEAMLMRPDGHPNHYSPPRKENVADCVHWCLPGPIDTWNEFLLSILKTVRKDTH